MASYTLSVSAAGAAGDWGDIALVFSGSGGPGASASGTGTGAGSVSVTTTGAHSAICAVILDANAVSGASRTWLTVNGTTPTAGNGYELDYTLVSGTYGVYVAYWPDAGPAGTHSVGLSAPSGMHYTAVATEVLGTTAPASPAAALAASLTVTARPAWTDAGAVMAAGLAVSATGVGYALQSTGLAAGLSLAGGDVTVSYGAELAAATGITATSSGWIYTGTFPLTYLQYLGAGGTLVSDPGVFTTAITPASGFAYALPVPPPDGRWADAFTGKIEGARAPGVLAPVRAVRKQHGQRSRSAYQLLGAR